MKPLKEIANLAGIKVQDLLENQPYPAQNLNLYKKRNVEKYEIITTGILCKKLNLSYEDIITLFKLKSKYKSMIEKKS